MITLFLLACRVEFKDLTEHYPIRDFMNDEDKIRSFEDLWVEQCAMKKEMGL